MKVALFIPCYVDAFFPEVGIATLELLERLGCRGRLSARPDLLRPADGQQRLPRAMPRDTEALFVKNFAGYDYIVTPSGSCAHHVRDHLTAIAQTAAVQAVRRNTYELVEFLHDVLQRARVSLGRIPARGRPAHRLRDAARRCATAKMSEIDEPRVQQAGAPARRGEGASSSCSRERPDECCGFGGTFSVFEEPVSAKMGYDKVDRPPRRRRRVHRLARHVVRHAPARLRRARSGCRSSSSTSRRS